MMWFGYPGSFCQDCHCDLSPQELKRAAQTSGIIRCDDCECEKLLVPGWFEDFMAKLWAWQFRLENEDQLGYN